MFVRAIKHNQRRLITPKPIKCYRSYTSTPPKKEELTPEEEAEKNEAERKQKAELAMQSIKDIGTMFSLGTSDKETEPIDTTPILEEPKKFSELTLLHQGQVIEELQQKYDNKWTQLTDKEKKLGYFIAYGNWGVRDNFDNWNKLETPYDLPFETPGKVKNDATAKVNRLPERNLAETPIRKPQFDSKKMDPVTKVFIYITLVVTLVALYRDKSIGEEGKPQEVVIIDPHEEERQHQIQQEIFQQEQQAKKKKWYYLWLW